MNKSLNEKIAELRELDARRHDLAVKIEDRFIAADEMADIAREIITEQQRLLEVARETLGFIAGSSSGDEYSITLAKQALKQLNGEG